MKHSRELWIVYGLKSVKWFNFDTVGCNLYTPRFEVAVPNSTTRVWKFQVMAVQFLFMFVMPSCRTRRGLKCQPLVSFLFGFYLAFSNTNRSFVLVVKLYCTLFVCYVVNHVTIMNMLIWNHCACIVTLWLFITCVLASSCSLSVSDGSRIFNCLPVLF